MKKYIFYLIVPIMVLFFNCSREKSDWKAAKTENSVQSYEQFIKEHPKSVYADSATYIFENVSLGFFGTQSIRTNRFTGKKEIYGDKVWQPIIITPEGNVTIPEGTRIVTQ